eukprot:sb/3474927/
MVGASNTSYKYGTPVALQRSLSPNPTPNSNPNSSPTPATYRSSNHVVIITLFRKACALTVLLAHLVHLWTPTNLWTPGLRTTTPTTPALDEIETIYVLIIMGLHTTPSHLIRGCEPIATKTQHREIFMFLQS